MPVEFRLNRQSEAGMFQTEGSKRVLSDLVKRMKIGYNNINNQSYNILCRR